MTDIDHSLRQHLREETDDILFSGIELSDRVKQKIRQQAAGEEASGEKRGRRFVFPKAWVIGAAALAAAVMIIAGFPLLQSPANPTPVEDPAGSSPPSSGGAVGSDLSQLTTTPLKSVEEAKEAFGAGLLVPKVAPKGFTLSEKVAVGMKGEPVRDVIFTYISGGETVTFTASRSPAVFPVDMFTPTEINGADGYVFEQPELVELYWVKDGIQYSIIGQISADEAVKIAESLEP